ncbi:NAD(P)-binding protein [Eremomyces bilateralis CBS 781.70]|uniref:Short-chain dehydrogenase/reductase 3 n=1 Tax=Eremomyces bilateralis CBS 781.70 TaxID=1392243 RepID=A0A6G1GDR7_9PEZI|nr:NAD(P)-binding protein [Eremomyces bilateralis CBS 781.70]KAF1816031.1 NAD(P)-binding protein [Eremomyces bilateralis CBS 781.70]
MPIRSNWSLAREGITFDTVVNLITSTALNPHLTLPLYLLGKYTAKGQEIAGQNGKIFDRLKIALAIGAIRAASSWLDKAVLNNFKSDVYDWNKEVVVVTGGSDGIGKIVTLLLAEKGIKVAVLDIQPLTFTAPRNVHYFNCDLANASAITETAQEITAKLGAPTVLINNAGFARKQSIVESSPKAVDLTFAINTVAHYHLAREFLPSMIKNNHGMVVTVASLAGHVTAPNMVDYAASKAAAVAFHEGLSAEIPTLYKAPKIRTVLVCQGYTKTPLFEGFAKGDGFMQYMLYPETVGEEIAKAVLSGRSNYIVLPANSWGVAMKLRALPLWLQGHMRKDLVKVMAQFRGRQVEQPSEKS